MNGNSDAVLWISLVLIAIVLTHQYAPVVKGMLFNPDYWQASTGTLGPYNPLQPHPGAGTQHPLVPTLPGPYNPNQPHPGAGQ